MDDQPFPDSILVTIEDDVFGPGVDWRTDDEMSDGRDASWVLLCPDSRAAAEALHRAAPKFYAIDEDGEIAAPDDSELRDEYTPNYVSNVRVFDGGAYVYVDTKSMFFPPMARTMMRLIITEIERLGVPMRIADAAGADYYSQGEDYAEALPPE